MLDVGNDHRGAVVLHDLDSVVRIANGAVVKRELDSIVR